MPAPSPTSSSHLWLLALTPLAIFAGLAGLQLGALTAPATHETAFEPLPAGTKASSSNRSAPSLVKPQGTPGASTSSSALSESPVVPQLSRPVPANVSPPPAERVRQLFARERALSPQPLEPVDPYQPGHSISGTGHRVFIESYQMQPVSGQNALHVAIVPETGTTAESAPISPTQAQAWPANDISFSLNPRLGVGFTSEELAFRAKWGWAAHDAALRAAFEEANRQSPR